MKKLSSVIISAAMLSAMLLSGCSGGNGGNTSGSSDSVPEGSEPVSEAASQAPSDSSAVASPESSAGTEASTPAESQVSAQASSDAVPTAEPNVRLAQWSDIEWEPYSCPYFTMTIPKGWQVTYDGNMDYIYFEVVDPSQKLLGVAGRDRANIFKDPNAAQTQGVSMYLTEGTVQEYFETIYRDTTDYFKVMNSVVPDDIATWQAVRPSETINDYKVLYAQFAENGAEGEGLYSALIYYGRDVVQSGINFGMWEADMMSAQWAPMGQLTNWLPVFQKIRSSFQYSQEYILAWQQANSTSSTPSSGTEDSSSILRAFEERDRQDTIMHEKESDMLEEYERVYDNQTGEIYRAYSGFLDDMGDQSRYTQITDSQYADGYKGWIDKPE